MATPENSGSRSRESLKTSTFLDGLVSADPVARESAARAIYSFGRDLAQAATKQWFSDADIAACFSRDERGGDERTFPDVTVGIAVQAARFEAIRQANGSPKLAEVPADIDASEFELHFGVGTRRARLDVLTARGPERGGALARFLDRHGEGIQQVELAVQHASRTTALLADRLGLKAVYMQARPGADGTLVNFILVDLPNEKTKLLIELVENPAGQPAP